MDDDTLAKFYDFFIASTAVAGFGFMLTVSLYLLFKFCDRADRKGKFQYKNKKTH